MKFTMPDTLAGLAAADLAALRTQAEDAFTELFDDATKDGATPTKEQLEQLEALSGNIGSIDGAVTEVAEDAARRDAAEALRTKVAKPEAKTEAEAPEVDAEVADADADATKVDAPDTDTDTNTDAAEAEVNEDAKEDAMAAAAGRRRNSFAGLKSDKGALPTPAIKGFSMNPHVAGYKEGAVTAFDLAEAYDRMRSGSSFGNRTGMAGATSALGLGSLPREFPAELVATDAESLTAAITAATNEKELAGNSLVAAGGWCAPSETVYDFLDIPAASELLSLPEVNINRGGIRFPTQPDFGAVFSDPNTFFHYTEAEMQTDYTKPCFEIPCGDFEEVRLDAIGLCITAGLLQQKGYPELVQVYIEGLLKNHMHRLSQMGVNAIADGSGAVINLPATDERFGAFGALLNAIEMAIVDMRLNQRIPDGTSLEVILPVWARAVLRADLAHRRGLNATDQVTNEQIDAHLRARGAVVQYVGEYQSGPGFPGGATPLLAWPDTIEFLVYPAGTWFRAMSNVIEVGVLYDQAQLKKNRYTALFTEDAYAVAMRGTISRRYSVAISPNGMVGAAYTAPVTP